MTAWSFHSLIKLGAAMYTFPLPNARLRSSSDLKLLLPSSVKPRPAHRASQSHSPSCSGPGQGGPSCQNSLLFGKGFHSNFSSEPS